ncbi:MAG: hypothetical protein HOM11_16405 [Methylococcales bacterium]|nr:hypothetical protein [Methylococcales bacterium]MBT7443941.1 hypothetical protein [Methylococcales bacterium]
MMDAITELKKCMDKQEALLKKLYDYSEDDYRDYGSPGYGFPEIMQLIEITGVVKWFLADLEEQ